MKKFTAAVTALHEAETSAKSELQKSYTEYFSAKLNKFGAKSPADLSPEQKSEFFSEISKDWERGVGAKPAGKKDVEEHGVKESEVNEAEVKSDADFKEYAEKVLKKAHGDKYDEAKAAKTIEGILKKADGDYGAAVGIINSSLGESEEVNEAARPKNWDSMFAMIAIKAFKNGEFDINDPKSIAKWDTEFNGGITPRPPFGTDAIIKYFLDTKKWPDGKSANESNDVNEGKEIKSDSDFKEYAEKVLKKAHGDKYDEEKAAKTIEGILKKADGDYGAAVGIINSSLGESEEVAEGSAAYCDSCDRPAKDCVCDESNESAECSMCGKEECECYKEKDANESINPLNEGATLYVSNPKFKDEASLKADILKNVGPALDNLLARNGVKYNAITAKEGRGRIELDSKPITGKDLGIMQYGFKSVWINSFGGGSFPQINKAAGEAFEFSPYIWFNLHYSYEHGAAWMNSTGSNGCSLYLPSERTSNVYYDVIEGRFLLESEAERRSDWK
jgi:hypothetical protein